MILETSNPEDVVNIHNEIVEELTLLAGEMVEGEFYKAISFLGDSFARNLLAQDEEFDLHNHLNNIVYIAMKIGYRLCEKQNMKVN